MCKIKFKSKNTFALILSALLVASQSVRAEAPNGPAASESSSTLLKQGRVETRFVLPERTSFWQKNYSNGLNALNNRRFALAEKLLLQSIHSSKGATFKKDHLVKSRLALGSLYLTQQRYAEAYDVYRSTIGKARSCFGKHSEELAQCNYGLARCQYFFSENKKAKENLENTIDILKSLSKSNSQLMGKSLHTLGLVLANFGWYDDTKKLLKPALAIMKIHPGFQKLELAEILKEQSLFFHKIGKKKLSIDMYEQSFKLKEAYVQPKELPSVVGEVNFVWEQGSTRSQEIIDNDYPFRYINASGVRVAATVIDLWELLGVLITVTNTTDQQQQFDLGEVVLKKVNKDNPKRKPAIIPTIDPNAVDRVQKELSMWNFTHNRPWLANVQKTRTVRGLVPFEGHDMFRGPNVYGIYGKWKAVSHIVPKKVGLNPSREHVLDKPNKEEVPMPGLMRNGNSKVGALCPVWLEPLESRTGYLFCLNPRDIDLMIKVPVGNATFELPFHTRKKYPH